MSDKRFASTDLKFVAYLLTIGVEYEDVAFTAMGKVAFYYDATRYSELKEMHKLFSTSGLFVNVLKYEIEKDKIFKIKKEFECTCERK